MPGLTLSRPFTRICAPTAGPCHAPPTGLVGLAGWLLSALPGVLQPVPLPWCVALSVLSCCACCWAWQSLGPFQALGELCVWHAAGLTVTFCAASTWCVVLWFNRPCKHLISPSCEHNSLWYHDGHLCLCDLSRSVGGGSLCQCTARTSLVKLCRPLQAAGRSLVKLSWRTHDFGQNIVPVLHCVLCRYYISCFYPASRTTIPYTIIETGITVSQVSNKHAGGCAPGRIA